MEELDDVKDLLPAKASVSDLRFEASDIVIYTDSKEFFLDNSETVKKIVSNLKKRVEVRPSPKLFKDPEVAKDAFHDLVDDEAGVDNVIFQPSLGKMIIRAQKPGNVIGNNGEGLEEIKKKTLWAPQVERVPSIQSNIVDRARELTVEDPEFRKDFLHDVGKKIRLDKSVGDEWIRVGALGGGRQVGRSSWLLQTEESNILMDAGINPSAEPGTTDNYPYLNAPELDLQNLDAVVLSHAHMDHCLTPDTPVTMADGTRKPIAEVEEGDKLKTVNWSTGEVEEGECTGTKEVEDEKYLDIRTPFNNIKASGDHKFFKVENLDVKEVKADKLSEDDLIPRRAFNRGQKSVSLEKPDYKERIELNDSAKKALEDRRKELGLSRKNVVGRLDKGENFVYELEEQYDSLYKSNLELLLKLYNLEFEEFVEKYALELTEYPEKVEENLAQVLGYFYGDGHKTGNRLRFTDKNRKCLEHYQDLLEEVFNYRGNIRPHPDRSKDAYSLEVNNVGIVRFLEQNFDGIYLKSTEGGIPQKVNYGDQKTVRGFLKGLFDAEGDVNQSIRISQARPETRNEIQNLLSSVGIRAAITPSDRRVVVSSKEGIRKFVEEIGSNHPEKEKRFESLHSLVKDAEIEEKLPVTSEDLHTVLEEAGMKGKVNGSPNYKDMPSCLVDWYRRDGDSLATETTVETLVETLETRLEDLKQVSSSEITQARKSLSVTRREVIESTSGSMSKVQLVEDQDRELDYREEIQEYLRQQVQTCIEKTEENIRKLEKILALDVEWHRITQINEEKNHYGYLVDIRVDPHHNFIASDQVVHNCGMIPYLYKMGYDGPLYCTKPTRDMMIMLCLDYIGIAHKENQEAPYDSSDLKKAVKRTITPDYGEVTDITPDMRLTLRNSGHILGSSLCHIHVGEGLHNVLYTGDYNYDDSQMLRPADTNFKRVETMITEATYGGKGDKQQPREEAQKKFLGKIKQTLKKGGKVIVPVFAVGRSQEILGVIAEELDREYFDYTVHVDGMIKDANALHTAYPEFLSKNVQKDIFQEDDSPFTKEQIHPIGSHSEREEVIEGEPSIILATSGMLTGGPVLSYIEALADNPDNAMIFVGYQASGTLGNKIQKGRSQVNINGKRVDINMDLSTVSGFSAHSDRQQIINFCKNLRSSPNRVLTNHGEESKCFSLASTLHKVLHIDTSAPQNLDVNRLN